MNKKAMKGLVYSVGASVLAMVLYDQYKARFGNDKPTQTDEDAQGSFFGLF